MKPLFTYFVLFISLILLQGCSLKHKWRTKQQEHLTYRNQALLKHRLTKEHVTLDTSLQYSHSQLQHYRLWYLSGNVQMHPDGSLETDYAVMQSWRREADSQQTTSLKVAYHTQNIEEEAVKDESTRIEKKSNYKEKRTFTINLWWLVLVVPLLLLWRFRRYYKRFTTFKE